VIEHHLEVSRTARYWTLGDPGTAREIWFVLHGYRQLARRFLRRFAAVDDGTRLIVAPEALSRFYVEATAGRHGPGAVVGATWMTREDREHEIADYVAYLDRLAATIVAQAPERSLNVLGFSQGVATATRWVVHGGVRPTRLILWGDFTPPDLDLDRATAALAGVEMVTVRGDADAALSTRLAAEEAARFAQAGIHVRSVGYAGGHDIHEETLVALLGRDALASGGAEEGPPSR
jgi:predicted esterase